MPSKKSAVFLALVVSLAMVGFAAGTATAGGAGSDACIPAYSYGSGDTVGTTDDGVGTSGCTNDGGGSGCYYGC